MQPFAVRVTETPVEDDRDIVRRARAGDPVAFEAIVRSRLPPAFRLATAILGDELAAADAVQDSFVGAWRELRALRDPDAFDAWFRRIVVNECRMQLRRRDRRGEVPLSEQSGTETEEDAAAVFLSRTEALDALERAFETLDADDRAMVVLHHLEGRPLQEIATALHMPVGTVKWRLHEARATLRHALEAER
ncbi:MAG TPA: sigma-70 family RNA polymerase sigma factor [Candidatus Limnocylindrales bacterium]|nr:sigma-70 family RNA polymerase sigma factor [Candidatus Limnocylindrales bacterium]